MTIEEKLKKESFKEYNKNQKVQLVEYDSVLEQMEKQKFKESTKKEIIDYVNNCNALYCYKNKTLFYEIS